MNNQLDSNAIQRVMVGTDRSETADRAVRWAAEFAGRYDAELFVVQVEVPHNPADGPVCGFRAIGADHHAPNGVTTQLIAHTPS